MAGGARYGGATYRSSCSEYLTCVPRMSELVRGTPAYSKLGIVSWRVAMNELEMQAELELLRAENTQLKAKRLRYR